MFIRSLHTGPQHAYANLIKIGKLTSDPSQEKTVELLHSLYEKLKDVEPLKIKEEVTLESPYFAWFKKTVRGRFSLNAHNTGIRTETKGLYMYGSVGTGKTMLMDLFFHSLPILRKKRIHFHDFMQDIHKRVHSLRLKHKITSDPIPLIATELADKAWLLCFDEFQVTDIADAMILRRLLTELNNKGVVLVSTSNRSPDELYSNGIQRSSFLPAIQLLKEMCHVHCLDAAIDYRKQERPKLKVYFKVSGETDLILCKIFTRLANGKTIKEKNIPIWGRNLVLKEYVDGVGKISFQELCGASHSAADFLALASYLKILILTDIPKMQLKHKNEARRFITLIDALYENKIKLFLSASTHISDLLTGEITTNLDDSDRLLMDDLKLSNAVFTSLFTGAEELFAFERAISRLEEMQSVEWIGHELQEYLGLECEGEPPKKYDPKSPLP